MGNCFKTYIDPSKSNISKNILKIDISKLKSANPLIIFLIGGPGSGKGMYFKVLQIFYQNKSNTDSKSYFLKIKFKSYFNKASNYKINKHIGTQSKKISEKYGLLHLSIVDLLCEEITSGSKRGMTILEIMRNGNLVPTEIMLNLLKERMNQNIGNTKGFIIDGFLKEKSQATNFENEIIPIDLIIYLQVNDDVLRERLQRKNIIYAGNADSTGCDTISSKNDIVNDVINNHIKAFKKNNRKILSAYKGKMYCVNGELDTDTVFLDVCTAVNDILAKRESQV